MNFGVIGQFFSKKNILKSQDFLKPRQLHVEKLDSQGITATK